MEQDLFILAIDMDPVYVQFVQEVVNKCGGEPGKIDTIGLFKVVNYQECLQKLVPHFAKLTEINPLNWPRNNADKIQLSVFVKYQQRRIKSSVATCKLCNLHYNK